MRVPSLNSDKHQRQMAGAGAGAGKKKRKSSTKKAVKIVKRTSKKTGSKKK
jgi:hypothetical protein